MKEKNIYILFGDFWLQKVENNQTTNYFKILNSKNRYMKIDNVFSPTKALISNGADPSGKISRNRGNQRNKKVWNAKNMVMMIKFEPERTRIEKTMQ